MRPFFIPAGISNCIVPPGNNSELCSSIRKNYARLQKGLPDVSVVIPAYNEAGNILATLLSLSLNTTAMSVEIIVVNNNSTDVTEQLVRASGVGCVKERTQGITAARNAGLRQATGKYILNADADTIYPADWIDEMIVPLEKNNLISLTYGRFAFIPSDDTSRIIYFFYEYIATMISWIKKYRMDEAVNVYGFNSGFRRDEGLRVGGFTHPPGSNEDGWLALKLRNKGFGRLHYVKNPRALVWTSDRRIQIDGGLWRASRKRIKRLLVKRHPELLQHEPFVHKGVIFPTNIHES